MQVSVHIEAQTARNFGLDIPASSTLTQEMLGWTAAHARLLEDLEAGYYFGPASE